MTTGTSRLLVCRLELAVRGLAWRAVWYLLVWRRLYRGPYWVRSLAAWGLALTGSIAYTPRTCDLEDRIRARTCEHVWVYDEDESQGPWTGYIERCRKCNSLQQVPV